MKLPVAHWASSHPRIKSTPLTIGATFAASLVASSPRAKAYQPGIPSPLIEGRRIILAIVVLGRASGLATGVILAAESSWTIRRSWRVEFNDYRIVAVALMMGDLMLSLAAAGLLPIENAPTWSSGTGARDDPPARVRVYPELDPCALAACWQSTGPSTALHEETERIDDRPISCGQDHFLFNCLTGLLQAERRQRLSFAVKRIQGCRFKVARKGHDPVSSSMLRLFKEI